MDNELEDFTPFATLFSFSTVKLMYEAEIKSEEDLLENEILLNEDNGTSKKSKDGYFKVHILATLTSDKKDAFGSLHFLFQIHNVLSNKMLSNKKYFGGLELLGNEEDGTPVVFLILKDEV